jgi:hypothetical protein
MELVENVGDEAPKGTEPDNRRLVLALTQRVVKLEAFTGELTRTVVALHQRLEALEKADAPKKPRLLVPEHYAKD